MVMMIMMKFDNRFKLKDITISAVKFGAWQTTNATRTYSSLYTTFLYHSIFGAFVSFACC